MAEPGKGAANVVADISGPVYVPAAGARPAVSEFRITYYPSRMRKLTAVLGQPWRHEASLGFYLTTDQDLEESDAAIRAAIATDEAVPDADGDDQPPRRVMCVQIPVSVRQCDLVVAEKSHNFAPIVHQPAVYPLAVPAQPPAEDSSDGC